MNNSTDLLSFVNFARDVIECIQSLTTTISDDECRDSEPSTQFCNALAEQLYELGEQLDRPGDTNYQSLAKILFELEKLITVRALGQAQLTIRSLTIILSVA